MALTPTRGALILLAAGAVALLGVVGWQNFGDEAATPKDEASNSGKPDQAPRILRASPPPAAAPGGVTGVQRAEYERRLPPNSRLELRLPKVTAGIEVTPGYFVPPLNGVRVEDNPPPARRDRGAPPPGPVVAKVTGPDGQEFWEHEDGTLTSSTWSMVTDSEGVSHRVVAVQHGRPTPPLRKAPPAQR